MLYNGAHPVHKKFGDSVDAEPFYIIDRMAKEQHFISKSMKLVKSVISLPGNFDFVLTESCYYYPAFKKRLGGMKKTKIINFSCGPLFYHLLSGRIKEMEKNILTDLAKEIDGHLVLGKYGEETVRKIEKEKPLRIVYPFIANNIYEKLITAKPDLNSKNIAIIATNDYRYKGLDIAIDSVKKAWEEDKNVRLNVIGNIDKKIIERLHGCHPAINHVGFVPSIVETLAKNALYLHPARGDTFPVSVLEAMAAGLPSIVSDETGTKEAVEKVMEDFVIERNPALISKRILNYFNMPDKDRKALSERARKEADFFTEEKMLKLFAGKFNSLIKEM